MLQSALRALLRVQRPDEATAVLADAIRGLGGELATVAEATTAEALPVDVGFGLGPPVLPVAPVGSRARARLERHLPQLVEDTRTAISNLHTSRILWRDASTDPLTGLLNRRATGRVLARIVPPGAVVVADLDHFKEINDRHGHEAGDRALVAFAEALRGALRQSDHVGRHGGEEFVLVLGGADEQGVRAVLDRLGEAWEAIRPLPVTFSAGVALLADGEAGAAAVRRADEAMFRAKRAGRDRIRYASAPGPAAGEER